MIKDGMSFFVTKPILVISPGICILIVSLGINYLGDLLRESFHLKLEDGI